MRPGIRIIILDQPFSNFVDFGLNSAIILAIPPGYEIPMAHPDDQKQFGAFFLVAVDDLSVFSGDCRKVLFRLQRRKAEEKGERRSILALGLDSP